MPTMRFYGSEKLITKSPVIVYGGSGFLGSHVCDALSDSGYQVRIFDCRPSKYLRDDQEMLLGDLMDLEAVARAAEGCEYVYNFAGLADIDDAKNQPITTVTLNVLGNVHTLEAARLCRARRFIFASSVYVYSETGSFYRASKQAAERFVEAYKERFNLDYTILRYGSLYGRRADERNGIFRLIKEALEQNSVTYKGSGDSMREYIHVTDAARLSVQILDESYANLHIILTGQERMAVKNLLKMMSEMIPGELDVSFGKEKMYGHYEMTPYAFHPKIGQKLVSNNYVDLGQGILDCFAEMHDRLCKTAHGYDDLLVDNDPSKE